MLDVTIFLKNGEVKHLIGTVVLSYDDVMTVCIYDDELKEETIKHTDVLDITIMVKQGE